MFFHKRPIFLTLSRPFPRDVHARRVPRLLVCVVSGEPLGLALLGSISRAGDPAHRHPKETWNTAYRLICSDSDVTCICA